MHFALTKSTKASSSRPLCYKDPANLSLFNVLHTKIQTYPQLLREMQQTRGLLILMTIWAYVERFFVHGHSLVRSFYPFFIHICSFLFISYILLPAFFRLSYVFTLHQCTWCIGVLGALVHWVHWCTWCIGALGAFVHLVRRNKMLWQQKRTQLTILNVDFAIESITQTQHSK